MRLFNFSNYLSDVFTLAICILLSLILLVINDSNPGQPFRKITFATIGRIGIYFHGVGVYFDLEEKNRSLRKENARLSYQNSQLQDALLENLRLRKLLEFKEKTEYVLIPAEVIGENPHSILNGYVMNVGTERGINVRDAVLTSDGLVGKIVNVDKNFSTCQILWDRNSRVSAKVQRNRELGVIAWDGGKLLKLLYIAKTIVIKIGDVIETSGYSQIFPPNIKIGVVSEINTETDGLFQEIKIRPAVNFNQLEEVFILKGIK